MADTDEGAFTVFDLYQAEEAMLAWGQLVGLDIAAQAARHAR